MTTTTLPQPPLAPQTATQAQTERERLRAMDALVERARGRSLTDVYLTDCGKNGCADWYWTGSDDRGNRKPKLVPYYTSDPHACLKLLRDLILIHGEVTIGGFPGPNTTDEQCWAWTPKTLFEKNRHSLYVTIALAYIAAKKAKEGE